MPYSFRILAFRCFTIDFTICRRFRPAWMPTYFTPCGVHFRVSSSCLTLASSAFNRCISSKNSLQQYGQAPTIRPSYSPCSEQELTSLAAFHSLPTG